MATIRATCPDDGDVDLTSDEMIVARVDEELVGYRFTCPVCKRDQLRRAEARVIELLLAAGVRAALVEDEERDRFDALPPPRDPWRLAPGPHPPGETPPRLPPPRSPIDPAEVQAFRRQIGSELGRGAALRALRDRWSGPRPNGSAP